MWVRCVCACAEMVVREQVVKTRQYIFFRLSRQRAKQAHISASRCNPFSVERSRDRCFRVQKASSVASGRLTRRKERERETKHSIRVSDSTVRQPQVEHHPNHNIEWSRKQYTVARGSGRRKSRRTFEHPSPQRPANRHILRGHPAFPQERAGNVRSGERVCKPTPP